MTIPRFLRGCADGINIDKFEINKPTLNDIFIEKVGE